MIYLHGNQVWTYTLSAISVSTIGIFIFLTQHPLPPRFSQQILAKKISHLCFLKQNKKLEKLIKFQDKISTGDLS